MFIEIFKNKSKIRENINFFKNILENHIEDISNLNMDYEHEAEAEINLYKSLINQNNKHKFNKPTKKKIYTSVKENKDKGTYIQEVSIN